MTKNKSNAMWGGRFASGQDTLMETYIVTCDESLRYIITADKRLVIVLDLK